MKITSIIEKTVPLGSAIANSYINFSMMTGSIIAIVTDVVRDGKQIIGYGFNSIGRYACTSILRDRMIGKILNADPIDVYDEDMSNIDPFKVHKLLKKNEKPGGHGDRAHAVGAIDMAVWDVVAKIEKKPLYQVIGERFNNKLWSDKIYTYAAGGYYYETDSIERLKDELKKYIDQGFHDVKMKIGGADLKTDVKRIEAALSVVDGDGSRLMVDANGRYDMKAALECAIAIKDFGLKWYEEPLDPADFSSYAVIAEYYPGPIATGENLFSYEDARNLFRHGGLRPDRDYIQVDPPLSYGIIEFIKILNMMHYFGWANKNCIPHGGNLFCNHIVAGLKLGGNECYPGIFQPFGGFADGNIIEKSIVQLPNIPGIGYEAKSNLWKVLRQVV
ncbi:MAG: hypothetical protein LBT51_04035 [Fusobacteriaceae bacterium]|nr:hypothetical protein [Fusobacteriaceae bacterium]